MGENRTIINRVELETNLEDVLKMCDELEEPVFITDNGEIRMVLMSIKVYRQMHFDELYPLPGLDDR